MPSGSQMANDKQPIENVRVVYVISRMIEFIDLANNDTLASKMRQLHELISRDKEQSKANLAQATATEVLPALREPVLQRWQRTTSRRVVPVVRHGVSVANRYAALAESLGLSRDGDDDAGSEESSGGSDKAARVLDWPLETGKSRRRKEPRRPVADTTSQDLVQEPDSGLSELGKVNQRIKGHSVAAESVDYVQLLPNRKQEQSRMDALLKQFAQHHDAKKSTGGAAGDGPGDCLKNSQYSEELATNHEGVIQQHAGGSGTAVNDTAARGGEDLRLVPVTDQPERREALGEGQKQQLLAKAEWDRECLRAQLALEIQYNRSDELIYSNVKVSQLRHDLEVLERQIKMLHEAA